MEEDNVEKFGSNISIEKENDNKVTFSRLNQNKGWDNSYGLTRCLSNNEKT